MSGRSISSIRKAKHTRRVNKQKFTKEGEKFLVYTECVKCGATLCKCCGCCPNWSCGQWEKQE